MTTQAHLGDTQSDIPERSAVENAVDRSFIGLTRILAFGVAVVLIWIAVQVGINAMPAIREFGLGFLTSSVWNPIEDNYGALPMIYGTLVSSAIALLFAIPIGVGIAIFLSEDFLPVAMRTPLIFLVELLAAIPSVVFGLWGIFVLVPLLRPIASWLHTHLGWFPLFSTNFAGRGMLPACIILTIMILPILTAIARDSLASVDPSLRQASMGMGATRWTTIFRVLIPAAFSGIIGGAMLALGRAMGETLAVTMLIGNATDLNVSLLAPANTIASLMANQFAEASGLQRASLLYAGLILFFLTLIVNMLAELVIRQVNQVNPN